MRSSPLLMLIVLVACLAAFQMAYMALGVPIPEAANMLTSFSMALALVLWMVADARKRRRVPCYDFGFLVAITLPVSLIWYVLWSRGWRGVLLLTALACLIYVPWLAAVAVWYLRYGRG